MLTLLTALLLAAAFLGALTGTLIHTLGATMPDGPDAGALLLGKIVAGLGQVCAVTAAAALLHAHADPGALVTWLAVFSALAVTASLATSRRVADPGRHRAGRGPSPLGATP